MGKERADRPARPSAFGAGDGHAGLCREILTGRMGRARIGVVRCSKNAKSAVCAILALGHLCGPLRTPGWRGSIASITKEKAAELRNQVAQIAEASGLDVTIRRSPYPGAIISATGMLETLSADRGAGHASGFDLVIVDETGLMPERSRELLAGLRSSVSAKGGRIVFYRRYSRPIRHKVTIRTGQRIRRFFIRHKPRTCDGSAMAKIERSQQL